MALSLRFLFFLLLGLWGKAVLAAPAPTAPVHAIVAPPTFDVETATQHYLNTLTPAQKAKSDAYFEGGYWLLLWGVLDDVVVAWVFLGLGLSARIRRWLQGVPSENLRNLLYAAM